MASNMSNRSFEALVEELENIIDSHNEEFVRYLLLVAQIMDLIPINFQWKQDILRALYLQGEISKIEELDRCLNMRFNDRVEQI